MDVEDNESWEMLKVHTIPPVPYMGTGTEVVQKLREEFEAENEDIAIPTKVRWLANPRPSRMRRLNGEIPAA